jgi:hypothetical protein
VGIALVSSWDKYKYPLAGLIFLSFVLNAAPVLVNWHLAVSEYPQAQDEYAFFPYQHASVWNGISLAIQGEPLPAPEAQTDDPVRSGAARFPDLWTFRLMEISTLGLLAGLTIFLVLSGTMLKYFVKLTVSRGSGIDPTPPTPEQ